MLIAASFICYDALLPLFHYAYDADAVVTPCHATPDAATRAMKMPMLLRCFRYCRAARAPRFAIRALLQIAATLPLIDAFFCIAAEMPPPPLTDAAEATLPLDAADAYFATLHAPATFGLRFFPRHAAALRH